MKVPLGGAVAVARSGERGSEPRPTAGRGRGPGGKPCKPPCRGSSLPGPEAAR